MPLDAISTQTRRWTYTGNGVTTAFAYNNYIVADSDLEVYLELIASPYTPTLQTLTTHYTVDGAGTIAGGNVNFVAAPSSAYRVVIVSKVPNTQPSTFNPRRALSADALTAAYHRLAAQVQQLQAKVDRSVRLADGDSETLAALPALRSLYGLLLGLDADGDIVGIASPDAPVDLTGQALKFLRVNAGETAYELITAAAAMLALGGALLTTRGDLLRRGASAVERVALGAIGTFLVSDGTDANWNYAPQTPSGFRLSLTTALAVTTADVTAAATLYMTPSCGNWVYIFDGTGFARYTTAELSLALDSNSGHTGYHQSGKNFDAFAFIASGAVDLGTGPAWSSDTARGTGAGTTELEFYNGVWVNKNAITLRFDTASGDTVSVAARKATYLGTFRCTANGQTEDSLTKRFLWNTYNRRPRPMRRLEATDSWTYTTLTIRQANGSTANQLDFVRGLDEDRVRADVIAGYSNASAGVNAGVGVGLDSTTTFATGSINPQSASQISGYPIAANAAWTGFPGIGRHFLAWLEWSVATGTTTWGGDSAIPSLWQTGIQGELLA